MKKILPTLLTATLGGTIALSGFYFFNNSQKGTNSVPITKPTIQIAKTDHRLLNNTGPSFEKAAEQTLNSVVHIKTTSKRITQNRIDPFQDFFFGRPQQRQPQEVAGSGSGVIISEDGYIATNNHVIAGANTIEITLNDRRTYEASVVGTDPTTDLALLKINENNLQASYYGNSDEVNIGEWVLAVGNPFNLTSTVTAGIVSAKARNINILKEDYAIESFIQTDAAVNPGNSGGALVNQKGELIGINTAIASNTGSYTGYSFAVPVNMVKKIMKDLAQYGTVQRALLGVQIREINQELANELNTENLNGVYISKIMDASAAADSDLQKGDIIKAINQSEVNTPSELQEKIGQFRPGDKILISYERNGKRNTTELTLKNKMGTTAAIEKELNYLGAVLGDMPDEIKKQLNIDYGVIVEAVEQGKFNSEGIKEGFIITKINNKPVKSADELISTLKKVKGGVLIEGVYPNGSRAYYGFGM